MKGINVIDRIDLNDEGKIKAIKGHIEPIKVIEVSELQKKFLNHTYTKETMNVIHEIEWKELELDYCGG